jgi:hypothetical protein
MLADSDVDTKDLTKILDYNIFGDTRLDIIRMLCNIKERVKQKDNQRKIQKIINHYAIEYDNILVLKPHHKKDPDDLVR